MALQKPMDFFRQFSADAFGSRDLLDAGPAESIHRLLDSLARGPGGLRLLVAGRSRGQVRAASLIHAFAVWGR